MDGNSTTAMPSAQVWVAFRSASCAGSLWICELYWHKFVWWLLDLLAALAHVWWLLDRGLSLELTIFTLFHLFRYAQAKRLGALKDAFASKFGKQAAAWPEELVWIVTDKEPLATPPAPST